MLSSSSLARRALAPISSAVESRPCQKYMTCCFLRLAPLTGCMGVQNVLNTVRVSQTVCAGHTWVEYMMWRFLRLAPLAGCVSAQTF